MLKLSKILAITVQDRKSIPFRIGSCLIITLWLFEQSAAWTRYHTWHLFVEVSIISSRLKYKILYYSHCLCCCYLCFFSSVGHRECSNRWDKSLMGDFSSVLQELWKNKEQTKSFSIIFLFRKARRLLVSGLKCRYEATAKSLPFKAKLL